MFDIKYDRDGRVIENKSLQAQLEQAATQTPVAVQQTLNEESSSGGATGGRPTVDDESTLETRDDLSQVEQEPVRDIPAQPEEDPVSASKTKSFRILRERAERAEQEKAEAIRLLRLEREVRGKPAVQPQEEPEETQIGDSDLAEGKHLKKVDRRIKDLEQQLQNYQRQSAQQSVEALIKSRHPDFDKVVSAENVEALKDLYPEIASTLSSSTDLYNSAVTAYTMIKKLGIHQEDTFMADKLKAQKNLAKPRPVVSLAPQQGDTPLSKANAFANGLTEELKAQLNKEMADARKNR